jgi:hypothetical protein
VTPECKGCAGYRQRQPCNADTKSSGRGDGVSRYNARGIQFGACIHCSWGSVLWPGGVLVLPTRPFWAAVSWRREGEHRQGWPLVAQATLVCNPRPAGSSAGLSRRAATVFGLVHTPQADGAEESGNLRRASRGSREDGLLGDLFETSSWRPNHRSGLKPQGAATIGRCGSGSGGNALT